MKYILLLFLLLNLSLVLGENGGQNYTDIINLDTSAKPNTTSAEKMNSSNIAKKGKEQLPSTDVVKSSSKPRKGAIQSPPATKDKVDDAKVTKQQITNSNHINGNDIAPSTIAMDNIPIIENNTLHPPDGNHNILTVITNATETNLTNLDLDKSTSLLTTADPVSPKETNGVLNSAQTSAPKVDSPKNTKNVPLHTTATPVQIGINDSKESREESSEEAILSVKPSPPTTTYPTTSLSLKPSPPTTTSPTTSLSVKPSPPTTTSRTISSNDITFTTNKSILRPVPVTEAAAGTEDPFKIRLNAQPAPPAHNSSAIVIWLSLTVSVLVCAAVGFVVYKRIKSGWYRRHYERVDFLIDGMYDDL